VNEDAVSDAFQRQFNEDGGGELPLNDVARMVGCWHGLSKRGPQFKDAGDDQPLDLRFSRCSQYSTLLTLSTVPGFSGMDRVEREPRRHGQRISEKSLGADAPGVADPPRLNEVEPISREGRDATSVACFEKCAILAQ